MLLINTGDISSRSWSVNSLASPTLLNSSSIGRPRKRRPRKDDLENDDLENDLRVFTHIFEDGSETFMGRNDDLSHNFLSQMNRRAKKSSYDKMTQRNKEQLVFTSVANLNGISL